MLWSVVVHVAPLSEGREVGARVVGSVVVAMSGGQDHPRRSDRSQHVITIDSEADGTAHAIAPGTGLGVPLSAVSEMPNVCPCGRPQPSQRPVARRKRITADSCGQSMG